MPLFNGCSAAALVSLCSLGARGDESLDDEDVDETYACADQNAGVA